MYIFSKTSCFYSHWVGCLEQEQERQAVEEETEGIYAVIMAYNLNDKLVAISNRWVVTLPTQEPAVDDDYIEKPISVGDKFIFVGNSEVEGFLQVKRQSNKEQILVLKKKLKRAPEE